MRTLPVLAASLFLTSVASATPDTPSSPTTQQISRIEGHYKLRDGRRAHIFGVDKRIYVRIGRDQQKELLMIGPNHFASSSGDLSILLRPGRTNDRIVLGYARNIGPDTSIRVASTAPPGRGSAD